MERLKETVTAEFEEYGLHRATRAIEEFVVEDLSRWYVKMVRDRTWKEGEDRGKLAAYKVLHEALLTTAQLLAPFCPHLAEELYQNLDGRLLSVHMCEWPKAREDFLNANLEMANVKAFRTLPAERAFEEMELALMPDPQAIGKVYKAWWSKIATILEMRPAAEVQRELQERGEYRMGIEGQMIKILPGMVRIERRLPQGVARVETP